MDNDTHRPCTHCPPSADSEPCCTSTCVEVAAEQDSFLQCRRGGCVRSNPVVKTEDASCHSDSCAASDAVDGSAPCHDKSCCSEKKSVDSDSEPCLTHLAAARARYAETLARVGCICRELVSRNIASCCEEMRAELRKRGEKRVEQKRCGSKRVVEDGCKGKRKSSGSGCCNEEKASCDAQDAFGSTSPISSCGKSEDSCCEENDTPSTPFQKGGRENTTNTPTSTHDLEKGPTTREHVVLSVEGLTCVGCENKLYRSLNAMPGIRNLQTSLVMARAEFDISTDADSADQVIKEVSKTTGFTCQRIGLGGHSLDVLVQGDLENFINQEKPRGVEDMAIIGERTVRVTYSAQVLGARELLNNTFDTPLLLAPPRPPVDLQAGRQHVRKTAYMTTFSTLLTIPVLVLGWAPLPAHDTLYGSISLALATVVQLVVAGPFYPSALKALLFTRVIEMDLLIVLSTSAAYIYSIVAFAFDVRGTPLSTGEFFETSTLLVTLIMVGRLSSAFSRQKAVESISLESLQSETALLVDGDGSSCQEIDTRLLQYGDVFKVLPDSCIPTDGVVIAGNSEVDESNITGEATPIEKIARSSVIAGSLNGSGTLIIRLSRLPGENTISEIATMVDAAKFSKPKIQLFADRVAAFFVPVIVVLTLIVFSIWIAVGRTVQHRSTSAAAVQAMTYAISVLIISCPCAIGLAVPMVAVVAGGVGAKRGVVFKSGETIEIARKVSHVVFDKTGTLTLGRLKVVAEEYCEDHLESASLALGLTLNSKHPVSCGVAGHLQARTVLPASIEDVKYITGNGLEGTWKGSKVCAGNSSWLSMESNPQVASMLSRGLTVLCIVKDRHLLAVYGVRDSIRPESPSVIAELQARGITISLLSGDDAGAVDAVAQELNIPRSHVRARCSPADKASYIQSLLTASHSKASPTVLFIGDGTNDAAALASATIGVHLPPESASSHAGSSIASTAADVTLLRPDLRGLLTTIDLSRAAFRRIVFNFVWSGVYNGVAVGLAAGVLEGAGRGWRVPPQWAGLGELVSVLPVVLVAWGLRWF